MRAKRVGSDTMLAQIVEMVADAQRSRAPIQRIADVVASYFVPAVVLVGGGHVRRLGLVCAEQPALAYALVNAVAVLIIACPCALGLATPMSIMVGVGRGAREGVLIKDAATLERLEKVDTLVVDKTGTLTEGRPRLTEVMPLGRLSEAELLKLAASVEQNSEHPLARAIIDGARERDIELPPVEDFDRSPAAAFAGKSTGRRVLVGKRTFFEDEQRREPGGCRTRAADQLAAARTHRNVRGRRRQAGRAAGGRRPDQVHHARGRSATLHGLWACGVIMLTGDNEKTARSVAETLGIDRFEAGVNPQDKNQRVKPLRARGPRGGDGRRRHQRRPRPGRGRRRHRHGHRHRRGHARLPA